MFYVRMLLLTHLFLALSVSVISHAESKDTGTDTFSSAGNLISPAYNNHPQKNHTAITELFARLPHIHSATLSPDGKRIGLWLNIKDQALIISKDINTGKTQQVLATDNKEFKFNWVRWVNNERLIISLRFSADRYRRPTIETRLLSVMYDGSDAFNLVKHIKPQMNLQDTVIDWLDKDPDHILMSIIGERDRLPTPAIYKVNVYDGQKKRIHRPASDITTWLTDQKHRVRAGIKANRQISEVIIADSQKNNWVTAWRFTNFSNNEVWPLGFDQNPDQLFVQAYHQDKKAIFKVDITNPHLNKELILADDNYDIEGELIYNPQGHAVGIHYNQGEYYFWDPSYQQLLKGIRQQLPGKTNQFVAFSQSGQQYILLSSSDTSPGTFYYGDRHKKILVPIGARYPWLEKLSLPETLKQTYTTRDNQTIESFLTLPVNKPAKNLPTVILPHGGPMDRDYKDYTFWAAFLAHQGYAVLRMNFRGSTGYGYQFMTAGFKNWGLKMQDDITDGTRWLIEQGIADPERICITGASYGGYAAMMGLVKTPDLFRCAISFAGIADLGSFALARNSQAARLQIGESIAQLHQTSPIYNIEKIRAPLLLIHGSKDSIVPASQSRSMKQALTENNNAYTYLELPNGDHYLSHYDNRLLALREIERFLEMHL